MLKSTVNRRFALFYPENRPFFRRGTWVFNTPGFDIGYANDNRLVDTRQIADPDWATKVVGQVGNHSIGALVANDAITNILVPGQQTSSLESFSFSTKDALLRYRYDFAGHSTIGVLATGRRGGGYDNGMVSVGGIWQIDPSDALTIQTAHSTTTYPDKVADAFGVEPGTVKGNAWRVSWQRTRSNYYANLAMGYISPGFRADLGYMPQVGYTKARANFEYDWYSHTSWWNNGGFGANYRWLQASGGGPVLTRQIQVDTFVHGIGQSHIVLYARHIDQYFEGKTFGLVQYELDSSARPLSWLEFELDATGGDGVDYVGVREGSLLAISPSFTLSPGRT